MKKFKIYKSSLQGGHCYDDLYNTYDDAYAAIKQYMVNDSRDGCIDVWNYSVLTVKDECGVIRASKYNYKELIDQINGIDKYEDPDRYDAALQELGEWFDLYGNQFWNGYYWDAPEADLRIRPVSIYKPDTDEFECLHCYEEYDPDEECHVPSCYEDDENA